MDVIHLVPLKSMLEHFKLHTSFRIGRNKHTWVKWTFPVTTYNELRTYCVIKGHTKFKHLVCKSSPSYNVELLYRSDCFLPK